jgi:Fe-S-cluster containining protein
VEISDAEKAQLEALDWAKAADAPPREKFFRPLTVGDSKVWGLGHQANGRCVFLNAAGLCVIHRQFGPLAKPVRCRQFPYFFAQTPTGVYTSLSYASRAARLNLEPELCEQKEELDALYKLARFDREHGAEVALTEEVSWPWVEYLAWEEEARAGIASAPAGQLWAALVAGERKLAEKAGEPVAEEPAERLEALNWRQRLILALAFTVFLRDDIMSGSKGAGEVTAVLLPLVARRRFRFKGKSFTLEQLAGLKCEELTADAEAMLRRFLEQSLFGKQYFGRWRGGEALPVLAGYRYLMLQYALTLLHVRLQGAADAGAMDAALETTCRSIQHRQSIAGGWMSPEQFIGELRALLPRVVPVT